MSSDTVLVDPALALEAPCRLLLRRAALVAGVATARLADPRAWRDAFAALPKHERLLGAFAALFEGSEQATDASPEQLIAALRRSVPALAPHLDLAEAAAAALPAVLAGQTPATDVLFPGGSMRLVEPIYRGNPWADHFNRLTAAAAVEAVAALQAPGRGPVRVLEIGAGTGGTSALVLETLAAEGLPVHYVYTDVSAAFVAHGRATFGSKLPQMTFRRLDIEQRPAAQGWDLPPAEIVIATNVLHATRRIDQTLAHVRGLMAPDGLLLLGELTRAGAFAALTFGLLDGWWRFDDGEHRLPAAPVLSAGQWRQRLVRAGFTAPQVYGWQGREDGFQCLLVSAAAVPEAVVVEPPAAAPLARRLRTVLARRLGFAEAELALDRPFAELGVDSIVAPQLAADLSAELGTAVDATAIYNHATLEALAAALAPELAAQPAPVVAEMPAALVAVQPSPMRDEDVAIIGMACRFPGAVDLAAFWRLLVEGRDAIRPVPAACWQDPVLGTAHAGLIDDADRFDPEFFHIAHAEAAVMDPQQRVFLELCWHALEDAGLGPSRLKGAGCGVYVGVAAQSHPANTGEARAALGNSNAILAARIAYHLDLKGPALPIDTACSSSLVAIHLAARAIVDGECELALAGGVSILLRDPRLHRFLTGAGMISPSGHCHTFDERADGFVPAEGAGILVLKQAKRALADGDRIWAVIRASGTSQDGRTSGITAPSGPAQTALLRRVWARAGIAPERIGLVEAHGTGTQLGDPIELGALMAAFPAGMPAGGAALGSVKTNIGHALTAAGVAGVIKAALALHHRTIPPSLHHARTNPRIPLESSPFHIPHAAEPFREAAGGRRIATVSSFGFSGTNAHLVLEEAPPVAPRADASAGPRLVLVSAQDAQTRDQLVAALAAALAETRPALTDVVRTLAAGRGHFPARLALLVESMDELIASLGRLARGEKPDSARLSVDGEPIERPDLDRRAVALLRQPGDAATLRELALLYAAGADADWSMLAGDGRPVGLPGYPFRRDLFPLPAETPAVAPRQAQRRSRPALDAGSPLLDQHRWDGRPVLPAAASLVLAAEAAGPSGPVLIQDVRWLRPIFATDLPAVEIVDDGGALRLVAGEAALASMTLTPVGALGAGETIAVGDAGRRSLDPAQIYRTFERLGFDYGPAFRVIRALASDGRTVQAELAPLAPAADALAAIPLLDGAIQAAIGLLADDGAADGLPGTVIPVGAARVWLDPAALPAAARATVRFEDGQAAGDSRLLVIALVDAAGRPVARIDGLEVRMQPAPAAAAPAAAADGHLLYRPVWRKAAPAAPAALPKPALLLDVGTARANALGPETILVEPGERFERRHARHFLLRPGSAEDARALAAALAQDGTQPALLLALWPLAAGGDATSLPTCRTLLHLLAGWLPGRDRQRPLALALAAPADGAGAVEAEAAAGMLASLAEEEPRLTLKSIRLADGDGGLLAQVGAELAAGGPIEVRLGAGMRELRAIERTALPPAPAPLLAEGAVVAITGGLGGLGLALAQQLWRRHHARLVLIGRSPPAPAARQLLADLREEGAQILTLPLDITDAQALAEGLARAEQRLGRLDTVHHLAAVQEDGVLAGRDAAAIERVLAAKVDGTAALLRVLAGRDVKIIGFGSIAGRFGSRGQVPYAVANRALAALLADAGGRTVDWGYWDPASLPVPGMHAGGTDEATERRLTGLGWMRPESGMELLALALAHDGAELLALDGDAAPFEARFLQATPAAAGAVAASTEGTDAAALALATEVIAAITGMPGERLRPDRPLEQYGLDSMMVTRANALLEQRLGQPVSRTLLFEHRTLRELAADLARRHAAALVPRAAAPEPPAAPAPAPVMSEPAAALDEPIAVIGMAGRYPEAPDLDRFWRNLAEGVDAIREIPAERWPLDGFFDTEPGRPGRSYSKWGGFLADVDRFDPLFFEIAPAEAGRIDPQERLFLETAWHCLEDAGLTRDALGARGERQVGVFVGVMYGDYQLFTAEAHANGQALAASAPYWSIANRVSYALGLEGPSMAVDTACSSSLTALHLACQAIRAGDCRMALVGGVNLSLHPLKYLGLSRGRFAASDGHCRSFGEGGDGYVPGEGVGALLLKPLRRALADGDIVHGVIRASAVNHGGRTNGYTVPSPAGQAAVIRRALERSGLEAGEIGYVEAHGTGTRLGDPIEIDGLGRALQGAASGSIAVGSAKASIGHLEAAAGIAGVTKVLLQMRHGQLPPMPGFGTLNPEIDLAPTPLRIQDRAAPWAPAADGRRRAAVSSFGAGGANAHVILEDRPAAAATADHGEAVILPLSARTSEQLTALAEALGRFLAEPPAPLPPTLADLAHTLTAGREHLAERLALVVPDLATARRLLDAIGRGEDVREGVVQRGRADPDAEPVAARASNLAACAALWVEGRMQLPVPKGRRISLPPRPFCGRRHWIESVTPAARPAETPAVALWPMQAVAGVRGRFRVQVPADAPELDDHRLRGAPILPGVALLDLVWRAVAAEGRSVAALDDIVWLKPFPADHAGLELEIALDEQRFEALGGAEVRLTGRLVSLSDAPARIPDLPTVVDETIDALPIYDRLCRLGLDYGPGMRALARIERRGEMVVGILAPGGMARDPRPLPPRILDGAFQTLSGLADPAGLKLQIPFALARLARHGSLDAAARILARPAATAGGETGYDLWILDGADRVLVELSGLRVRRVPTQAAGGPVLLRPVWVPATAEAAMDEPTMIVAATAADQPLAEGLRHHLVADPAARPSSLVYLATAGGGAEVGQAAASALGLLRHWHGLPAAARADLRRLRLVADRESLDGAALAAVARTLSREQPGLRLDILDPGEAASSAERLAALLRAEPGDAAAGEIRHRGGRRLVQRLQRLEPPTPVASPWPERPVALIIGGMGGVGRVLAEHLARHRAARIALVGRSPESAATRAFCDRLRMLGGDGRYLQADATDPDQLAAAIAATRTGLGPIAVAVHAALVMADRPSVELDAASFDAAFRPRAGVAAHLLAGLVGSGVERLLLFSSANVFLGSPGQAAYVAGNQVLTALAAEARRAGMPATVVHWGLWGEVGAVRDAVTQARVQRREGVLPILPAEGMAALDALLASGVDEAAIVKLAPERADLPIILPGVARAAPGIDRPAIAGPLWQEAPLPERLLRAKADLAGLEDRARRRLALLLRRLLAADADRRLTFAGLERRLGSVEAQRPLLAALLAMLERAGLAEATDGLWRIPPLADAPAIADPAAPSWLQGLAELLAHCIDGYPALLHGQIRPVDLLFPGGDDRLVRRAYADNPLADHANALVADAVRAEVEARLRAAPGRTVRILEIGGGTGSTTAAVLAALEGHERQVSYLFTDIAPSFLARAAARHGNHWPGFATAVLDLARPPAAQGIDQPFDIVVAANVVHATARLDTSLGHLAACLGRHGRLLLIELTRAQDLGTLVFGTTPGWWLAEDAGARLPHGPAASLASWQALLAEAGFGAIEAVGVDAPAGQASQSVITALSDGWRMQQDELPAAPVPVVITAPPLPTVEPRPPVDGDRLRPALMAHLRSVFAAVLGVAPAELREGDTFERYGLESLSAVEIRNRLEQDFPGQPATLLFEQDTLARLASHLLEQHAPAVAAKLGEAAAPPASAPPSPDVAETVAHPAEPSMADVPIAVIGFAGRFPGAESAEALFEMLRRGGSGIRPVPAERWDHALFLAPADGPLPAGRTRSRKAGFLDHVDRFDPELFGIAPVEALSMDPQERLFLEAAWAALEDAGTTPARLQAEALATGAVGGVGVFCGVMNTPYQWLAAEGWSQGQDEAASSHFWSIPNRVSYLFDFDGPSMAVDTACSSSLMAVHLAVDALRHGDCGAALVGGVNVIAHPRQLVALGQAGMTATGDACHAFGAEAEGFVDGEGVAVLVLKPLPRAIADGDRIDGVILASAVNAGGKTGGFTVPSPRAQTRVIQAAMRRAGVTPDMIALIETHGTGTRLGDPIELRALEQAHGAETTGHRIPLGTLKADIGHLESAAGAASLVKLLLQLRHERILPARSAATPNPLIEWQKSRFFLPEQALPWRRGERRRIAAVSGFGAGGANAHLLLAEAPATAGRTAVPLMPELLPLSARTDAQLRALAATLADRLAARAGDAPDQTTLLADLGRTLRRGRVAHGVRALLVGRSLAEALAGLRGLAAGAGGRPDPALLGAHASLARQWLDGAAVDWESVPADPRARPLSLPTYPFAQNRYWLDVRPQAPAARPVPPPSPEPVAMPEPLPEPVPATRVVTALLRRSWQPVPATGGGAPGRLLLVGAGDRLARAIGAAGWRVEQATGPAEAAALLGADSRDAPDKVLLVEEQPSAERLVGLLDRLRTVAAALVASRRPALLALALPAGAQGLPVPVAMAAAAFLRSLRLEQPQIATSVLTLVGEAGSSAVARAVAQELVLPPRPHVLLEPGRRLVERVEMLEPGARSGIAFRARGTYLLVGGLGEVGRALAIALVRRYGARIGIIGRRPEARVAKELAELAAAGCQAAYMQADLDDPQALRRALDALKSRLGAPNGILHLARTVVDALLLQQPERSIARVLAPKVQGSLALLAAVERDPLDWIVLFSSLGAWAGLKGSADYAAACAFQDGLAAEAEARGGDGPSLIAIAWPQWAHDLFLTEGKRRFWSEMGLSQMDADSGIEALLAAIGIGGGALAAVRGRSQAIAEIVARMRATDEPAIATAPAIESPAPIKAVPEPVAAPATALDRLDLAELRAYRDYLRQRARPAQPPPPVVDDTGELADRIARIAGAYLLLAPETVAARPFADLGLDSIKALRLAERLQRELGRKVEPAMLFAHPTVASLAAALADAPRGGRELAGAGA